MYTCSFLSRLQLDVSNGTDFESLHFPIAQPYVEEEITKINKDSEMRWTGSIPPVSLENHTFTQMARFARICLKQLLTLIWEKLWSDTSLLDLWFRIVQESPGHDSGTK